MSVLYKPHEHDLPRPSHFPRGSVVRCECGAIFTGGNPGNPAYSSWRRLGWFGLLWRSVAGRI